MARTQVCISSGQGNDLYNLSVWDVTTGNILSTYKPPKTVTMAPIGRRCVDMIGDQYLICGYEKTPIVNVWCLDRKDHLALKMILPGHVQVLAVTPDGNYCLVGIGNRIYIWQVATGFLLNILERHYQNVTHIAIASDASFFVTGGQDGLILIWKFSDVLSSCESFSVVDGRSSVNDPWRKIVHSTNAISGLYIGHGNAGRAIAAVVSEDNICRLYRLHSGACLQTILFGVNDILSAVTFDLSEIYLYVGTKVGSIFKTKLVVMGTSEAVAGLDEKPNGAGGFIQLDVQDEEGKERKEQQSMATFAGHEGEITSLAVTIDGHGLVSGSVDATIKVWHVESHQCMRTITHKGAVDNVLVRASPSGLFTSNNFETAIGEGNSSADPSLASVAGPSRSRSTAKQSSSFEARFTKTNNTELSIATAQHPPPPVSPFEHQLYRPPTSAFFSERQTMIAISNDSQRVMDPFAVGSLPIRNGPLDGGGGGQGFRPWANYLMPSDKEIDDIYNFQDIGLFSTKLEQTAVAVVGATHFDLNGQQSRKGKKRRNMTSLLPPNGSGGEQQQSMFDGGEPNAVNQIGAPLSSANQIATKLKELVATNRNLYQYSIEHFFNNLGGGQ